MDDPEGFRASFRKAQQLSRADTNESACVQLGRAMRRVGIVQGFLAGGYLAGGYLAGGYLAGGYAGCTHVGSGLSGERRGAAYRLVARVAGLVCTR